MPETKKPSVMVVDDDPDMTDLVSYVAQSKGFDVCLAADAAEFMAQYKENAPSAIVMDIVMPGMDGLELLDWLANENCTAPIALMSGYDGRYIEMSKSIAMAKGVNITLTMAKPFRLEQLETFLQQITNPETE